MGCRSSDLSTQATQSQLPLAPPPTSVAALIYKTNMLDAALSALRTLLTLYHMGLLIFGAMVGLLIGILSGLGGIVGMSILLYPTEMRVEF